MRTRKWCIVNDKETKGRFVKQERKSSIGSKQHECGNFWRQSGFVLINFLEISLI